MTKRFLLTVLLSKFFQRAYFLNVQGRKLDFHRNFLTLFPVQNFQHNFFQFLLGLTNASCLREIEKKMLIQNFRGITTSIMVFFRFWGGPTGPRTPLFVWNFYYFNIILRKIKSIYVAGKCPRHPFLNFLDPPLKKGYPVSRDRDCGLNVETKIRSFPVSVSLKSVAWSAWNIYS